MPATQPPKKTGPGNFFKFVIIVLTVIIPTILLVGGIMLFYRTGTVIKAPKGEKLQLPEGAISPSQLLEKRSVYKDKKLTIVGKIGQSPVTCERKDCPKEDPCCGCPDTRNLEIVDADKIVLEESVWRLRLTALGDQPLCQRRANSCDYECSDWQIGDTYQVKGIFFAELPPMGTGWRMYFDFHFEVQNKELLKKANILDFPGRVIKTIQSLIKKLTTSGQYVLP